MSCWLQGTLYVRNYTTDTDIKYYDFMVFDATGIAFGSFVL